MSNPDRLSALDVAFLDLERGGPSHMHVASVMIFRGEAPARRELVEHVQGRLHLVPRYRQRLAFVPLGQGRPTWVDDPHFNAYYHIRNTALPAPADERALKELVGYVCSQRLDRHRPLWEIWLVERLAGGRFAMIAKAHHALVDGISGVDITTVLLDGAPAPDGAPAAGSDHPHGGGPPRWVARPLPGRVKLLGDALLERALLPGEVAREANAIARAPRRALRSLAKSVADVGALTWSGIGSPAPPSPFNVEIGPHRRYTFVDAELERLRAIKERLGGTINDAVLAAVSLALGEYLRLLGHETEGLELRAMIPVSVRAHAERGALGNRVAAMWAPLPVGIEDPARCHERVREAMRQLKLTGQAVGAQVLTSLAGFAPPTILSQAARLQARQRYFNIVVTNVPGPQVPLYLLGRELAAVYPVLPLARRQALSIAVMSYNGRLGFGLVGDYDALPELDLIGGELERGLAALARAAAAADRARARRRARAGRQERAAGGRTRAGGSRERRGTRARTATAP
jgi:diacylglycerol O-acyltransferase